MKNAVLTAALFAAIAFFATASTPSWADVPQTTQTLNLQAQVQAALRDAQMGKFDAVNKIYDEYGDTALKYFADARFDPDANVRKATLYSANDSGFPGFTETSLHFLLPLLDDLDTDIAMGAAGSITDIRRPPKSLRQLDGVQVVRMVKNASARNPELIRRIPEILLLLAQFKQSAAARSLVNRLVKDNRWDASTATAPLIRWDRPLMDALIARCEIGTITTAQVFKVLEANPKARILFLNAVNLIADETLLRYAFSLLYDTTVISPGGFDYEGECVCRTAKFNLSWATSTILKSTTKNGTPHYDTNDMENLYKFYGLKM